MTANDLKIPDASTPIRYRLEYLLAVMKDALAALDSLTTEEFSKGGDRPIRDALNEAIRREEGKSDALKACIAGGLHLTDCDDDGYCRNCREQDGGDYQEDTP